MLLFSGTAATAFAQDAQTPAGDRDITLLRGDLYVVRDGKNYTVFLVTPGGIILGDPLTRPTALWLKEELATRFPGLPVRFVLHSHHHVDRAEGAAVFNETAELVGHRRFNSALADSRRSMPEAYRFVRDVETIYDDRRTVMLAGQTVDLVHVGSIHSPDLTALYFPRERVVFAVEPPPLDTVPFSFRPFRPRAIFEWLHAVTVRDFDALLTGDGRTLDGAIVFALARYLDDLQTGVAIGYEQGQTLPEIQASLLLDAHRANPHYAGRTTQIGDVYRTLRMLRADVSGAAIANYGGRNPSGYCATYTFCVAGGAVAGGTAAAAFQFGRAPAVVAEITLNSQSWSARSRNLYDEEVALRQSRGALLGRYAPRARSSFSYAVLGGVSQTVGDVRGMNRVQGLLVPAGGRHAIAVRTSKLGVTLGADAAWTVRPGLSLVVPVRVTRIQGQLPQYWPSRFDVHGGLGVRVRLLRRVS
jgi:glyoxylase-like metal-dependent hydrolase (beta-lactamase superfamily II)